MLRDGQLAQLAAETAAELEDACATAGLLRANERDHLHPACRRAVERLAKTWQPAPAIGPYGFGDRLGWVGLGHVDVVLRWPDAPPTFLELKCGSDRHALAAVVWDAVKLSAGLLAGNAQSGYLLAGAPRHRWREPILGATLLDSRVWQTSGNEIRGAYSYWWRFWQSERTPHVPRRVAATFRTIALGSFPLAIAETPWELRLARVEPVGTTWAEWQPVE